MRVGFGYDIHRFGELKSGICQIKLCGVALDSKRSIIAHSDGDAVLHAVVDALLGASSLGDIGTYYPSGHPDWKDKNSAFFVKDTVSTISNKGFVVSNIDVAIYVDKSVVQFDSVRIAMQKILSELLNVSVSQVNVKTQSEHLVDRDVKSGNAVESEVFVLLGRADGTC